VAEGLGHPRHELVLGVGMRGVAHHPLFFVQLRIEQQRVGPAERRLVGGLRFSGAFISATIILCVRGGVHRVADREACVAPPFDRARPSSEARSIRAQAVLYRT